MIEMSDGKTSWRIKRVRYLYINLRTTKYSDLLFMLVRINVF